MSLRLRILLLVTGVNVGVLLLVVWLGLRYARAEAPVASAAVVEALEVAQSDRPNPAEWTAVRFLVRRQVPGSPYESFAPEGAGDLVARIQARLDAAPPGFHIDGEGLLAKHASPDAPWHAYYVGFHERARRDALGGLRRIYLLLCAGMLGLIVATYLILRRLVLRPLDQLDHASRAVAEGRAPEPVPEPSGHEMARLVRTFNQMAREVGEYQQKLEDRVLEALQRVTAAESRLVVAQRLAATGTLAAGFAHEINNPLGGILNALRRLREGGLPEERREEYYDLVLDGLDRIRTIVERILHFTPRQREPATLDLADIARRAVDLAGHRADRRGVRLALEDASVEVVGDAQELVQAALNVLLNAIDAVEEGAGRVTVRVRPGREDDGNGAVLEVGDDGAGMDEETRRRCVDLFFSTKPEGQGTGLGLGIVQHIVTDHGGALEIDSSPGGGTTVRLVLPAGIR